MKVNTNVLGITVDILKHQGQSCDNGLFSSRLNGVTIIGSPDFPMPEGWYAPDADFPAVVVVKRTVCRKPYLTAYPVLRDGTVDTSCMFGGTFIHSSDSRFCEISDYPIPLHDRKE